MALLGLSAIVNRCGPGGVLFYSTITTFFLNRSFLLRWKWSWMFISKAHTPLTNAFVKPDVIPFIVVSCPFFKPDLSMFDFFQKQLLSRTQVWTDRFYFYSFSYFTLPLLCLLLDKWGQIHHSFLKTHFCIYCFVWQLINVPL